MSLDKIVELQRKRMGLHNGYTSNDEMNSSIFDDFETNPAYQIADLNGEDTGIHVLRKQTRFGEVEVNVITKPEDQFPVGSYLIDRDGQKWLCHSVEDFPIRKHSMLPCNNTMKWETDLGEIHEIDCVLTDKTSPFASGVSNGKIIGYPNDQIMVVLPNDKITRTIHTNKRFIFDHDRDSVYKATTIDRLTLPILQVKLRHDVYIPAKDSLELNLADYEKEDANEPSEGSGESYIIIDGESRVNAMSPITVKATVYENGEESDSEVIFSLSNKLATIKSQDGRECVIEANKNWNFGDLELTATSKTDETLTKTKSISVTGL